MSLRNVPVDSGTARAILVKGWNEGMITKLLFQQQQQGTFEQYSLCIMLSINCNMFAVFVMFLMW